MRTLEEFEAGGSHYDVGFAIGRRFAEQIHQAFDAYDFLQRRLLPYHHRPEGESRYQQLLRFNRTQYPDYVAELQGMAEGSDRTFEELFLVNMRGEYRGYEQGAATGCFDCALFTDDAALIGHNEDGSPAFQGNTYVVHAKVSEKPAFTALSYPGFLCGNAFGFNSEGICFSVDHLSPRKTRVGVGRHFLARSLLESRSLDDAIDRVIVPGRASGFGYSIGSVSERKIMYLEVSPGAHHAQVVRGCYVHANHYQELTSVDQAIEPSSQARVERGKAILQENAPSDAAGVLSILGDQADEAYPIFRTATPPDGYATFHTALFDLDDRRLRIYTGHPSRRPARYVEIAM